MEHIYCSRYSIQRLVWTTWDPPVPTAPRAVRGTQGKGPAAEDPWRRAK